MTNEIHMQSFIVSNYMQNYSIKKLHLGCGYHCLPGWLNADFFPQNPDILHLDVTQQFPFEDELFDYIFTEHMIEHITYPEGIAMLRNCYRVLKPNGKIRIATPDLAKLIALFTKYKSEEQVNFIKEAMCAFMPHIERHHETFVINHSVRSWGHQFIYEREVLTDALEQTGFKNITISSLSFSHDPHLMNLESRTNAYDKYETMVLEAIRN